MGIYIFSWPRLKQYLVDNQSKNRQMEDFGHHVIPAYLRNSEAIYAYSFEGYWKDVGTLESLWSANMEFLDPEHDLNIRNRDWRVYSKSPNTTPQFLTSSAKVKDSMITDGCYVAGEINHSILSHNVKVGKNSVITDSFIMPNAVIGENVRIEKAIVGEGAHIFDDAELIGTEDDIAVAGYGEEIGGYSDEK